MALTDIAQRHMRELLERDFNNLKQDIRMLEKIDFDKIRVEIAEIEKKVRSCAGWLCIQNGWLGVAGSRKRLCYCIVFITKAGRGRDAQRAAALDGEGREAHAAVCGRFRRYDHGRRRRAHAAGHVRTTTRELGLQFEVPGLNTGRSLSSDHNQPLELRFAFETQTSARLLT